MARRTWTTEQRAQALELYAEHGAAAAARTTGIPSGTVKAWASRRGVQPLHRIKNSEGVRAAVERRQRTAEDRRTRLVELLGEIAELGAERELELLSVESVSLRDVVGARTRAIHDLQLLAGDATSRTEHTGLDADRGAVEERLATILQIADRRTA